jgi:hypothetical protein
MERRNLNNGELVVLARQELACCVSKLFLRVCAAGEIPHLALTTSLLQMEHKSRSSN